MDGNIVVRSFSGSRQRRNGMVRVRCTGTSRLTLGQRGRWSISWPTGGARGLTFSAHQAGPTGGDDLDRLMMEMRRRLALLSVLSMIPNYRVDRVKTIRRDDVSLWREWIVRAANSTPCGSWRQGMRRYAILFPQLRWPATVLKAESLRVGIQLPRHGRIWIAAGTPWDSGSTSRWSWSPQFWRSVDHTASGADLASH